MIPAIILVGICIKLALIFVLITSSVGYKTLVERLKSKLGFSEVKETVLLTRNLIEDYENAINAMKEIREEKSLKSESEEEEKELSTLTVNSLLSIIRNNTSGKSAQIKANKKSQANQTFEPNHSPPESVSNNRSGLSQEQSPVDIVPKTSFDDCATAPISISPPFQSLVNIKKFINQSTNSKANDEKTQQKKLKDTSPVFGRKAPINVAPKPRSKLAVKLEKKLAFLESSIYLASIRSQREVLFLKIQRLNRSHRRRHAFLNSTVLQTIEEESCTVQF